MACLRSSAASQKLQSAQRCSFSYRLFALIEEFLRLSPYGTLMFAAPAAAHGLSRSREWQMRSGSRGQECYSLLPRDFGG